jgi:hypothetical protein
MVDLPASNKLPVEYLAASFSNVTNSYKFYWFLSILEYIKENQTSIIPLNKLLANMVGSVWYPTNYFRLSFGKQDRLNQIALKVKVTTGLAVDAKKGQVVDVTLTCLLTQPDLSKEIFSLGRFVPQRFLRPFFQNLLKGKPDWQVDKLIVELADNAFTNPTETCLYRFVNIPEEAIELQPDWFDYLQRHLNILTGFCLWHLVNYLQKNNPNVPNLASKLFEPEKRDLKQARAFWRLVFDLTEPMICIYSGQTMDKDDFSLDHFLPWRFVTHDLLWNIIPTPKNVNSAKSDNLPKIDLYFAAFAQRQYTAFQSVANLRKTKLLEDYVLLFKKEDFHEVKELSSEQFVAILHDTIVPQIQIAKNMGFTADWSYSAS